MAFKHGIKPIVTDGLVFCVDPANKVSYVSGSSTTFNLIDSSISGSVHNDVDYSFNNAGIWEFDGTDDNINLGNNDIFSLCSGSAGTNGSDAPNSIDMWFNTSETGWQDLMAKIGGGVYEWRIAAIPESNIIRLQTFNSGSGVNGRRNYNGSTSIPTNTWHNVIVTYDGAATNSSVKMYLNGQPINVSANQNGVYLGMDNTDKDCTISGFSAGFLLTGKMSTVKMYKDKVLSASEVLQNYNALKNRFRT
jgi:hypothetical protein